MAYRNRKSRRQFHRDLPRPDVASGVERLLKRRRLAPPDLVENGAGRVVRGRTLGDTHQAGARVAARRHAALLEMPAAGGVRRGLSQPDPPVTGVGPLARRIATSEQLPFDGRTSRGRMLGDTHRDDVRIALRRKPEPCDPPPTGQVRRSLAQPAPPAPDAGPLARRFATTEQLPIEGRTLRGRSLGDTHRDDLRIASRRECKPFEPPAGGQVRRGFAQPDAPAPDVGPLARRIAIGDQFSEAGRTVRGRTLGDTPQPGAIITPRRARPLDPFGIDCGQVRRGVTFPNSLGANGIIRRRTAAHDGPAAAAITRVWRNRPFHLESAPTPTSIEVDLGYRAEARLLHFAAAGEPLHFRASGLPLHYRSIED